MKRRRQCYKYYFPVPHPTRKWRRCNAIRMVQPEGLFFVINYPSNTFLHFRCLTYLPDSNIDRGRSKRHNSPNHDGLKTFDSCPAILLHRSPIESDLGRRNFRTLPELNEIPRNPLFINNNPSTCCRTFSSLKKSVHFQEDKR